MKDMAELNSSKRCVQVLLLRKRKTMLTIHRSGMTFSMVEQCGELLLSLGNNGSTKGDSLKHQVGSVWTEGENRFATTILPLIVINGTGKRRRLFFFFFKPSWLVTLEANRALYIAYSVSYVKAMLPLNFTVSFMWYVTKLILGHVLIRPALYNWLMKQARLS